MDNFHRDECVNRRGRLTIRRAQWLPLSLAVLALTLLAAGVVWGILPRVNATRIGDILDDPSAFDRTEVHVRGTVQRAWPIGDVVFVELADKTGVIWCRLKERDVEQGQKIPVTGTVYKLLDIPGIGLRVPVIAE